LRVMSRVITSMKVMAEILRRMGCELLR